MSFLSRFLEKPTKPLHNLAIRVLRYLAVTKSFGIRYSADSSDELLCFSDSDYAADVQTRRSVSGTAIVFGGGLTSWFCRRQKSVSLSTLEAEIIALSECVRESTWVARLLAELGINVIPSHLADNQAAIAVTKGTQTSRRARHISVRYFYAREKFQQEEITLTYCESSQKISDLVTKSFDKCTFQRLRSLAGVVEQHADTHPEYPLGR